MVTLDHICGVDEFADLRRVLEKSSKFVPIGPPGTDNEGIFRSPDFLETVEFKQGTFLGSSLVYRL
ncbi:hypothetical protein D3C81_1278990 [compost metagenome]